MAVVEVTMYRIVCDHEGCTNSPQDGGEYYAYADADGAFAEADDSDWYIVRHHTKAVGPLVDHGEGIGTQEVVNVPDIHLCPDHHPQCKVESCGAFLRDDEFGDYCEDHAEHHEADQEAVDAQHD